MGGSEFLAKCLSFGHDAGPREWFGPAAQHNPPSNKGALKMGVTKHRVVLGMFFLIAVVLSVSVMEGVAYAQSDDIREYYDRENRNGQRNQIPATQIQTSDSGRGVPEQFRVREILAVIKYELAKKSGFPDLSTSVRKDMLRILSDPDLVLYYTDKQKKKSGVPYANATAAGQATEKNRALLHQAAFYDSEGKRLSNHKIAALILHELGHVHQLRYNWAPRPLTTKEWFPNELAAQLPTTNFANETLDEVSRYIEKREAGEAEDLSWLENTASPAPAPPPGGLANLLLPPPGPGPVPPDQGEDVPQERKPTEAELQWMQNEIDRFTDLWKSPTDKSDKSQNKNNRRGNRNKGQRNQDTGVVGNQPTERTDPPNEDRNRQESKDKMQPVLVRGNLTAAMKGLTSIDVTMRITGDGVATLSSMSFQSPPPLSLQGSFEFQPASGKDIRTQPSKQGGPPVPVSVTFTGQLNASGYDFGGDLNKRKASVLFRADRQSNGSWHVRQSSGDSHVPPMTLRPVSR